MKLKKIKLEKKGLESLFSPLEADVLNILLSHENMRVREIYNKLKRRRKVALTSIAVILDRLYKKGVVKRHVESGRGGMHYLYSTSGDRVELEKSIMEITVNKLIDVFGSSAVSYFNERFAKRKRNVN